MRVIGCFDSEDRTIQTKALMLISRFSTSQLNVVLKLFDTFSKSTKKRIIMHLMTINTLTPYVFLLDYLARIDDTDLVDHIVLCLGKTSVTVFPLILQRLDSNDLSYIARLKQVLNAVGFKQIELYLTVMPQIPHEQYFRDVFGDDAINAVKLGSQNV